MQAMDALNRRHGHHTISGICLVSRKVIIDALRKYVALLPCPVERCASGACPMIAGEVDFPALPLTE